MKVLLVILALCLFINITSTETKIYSFEEDRIKAKQKNDEQNAKQGSIIKVNCNKGFVFVLGKCKELI